jgi:hypothetical protein
VEVPLCPGPQAHDGDEGADAENESGDEDAALLPAVVSAHPLGGHFGTLAQAMVLTLVPIELVSPPRDQP